MLAQFLIPMMVRHRRAALTGETVDRSRWSLYRRHHSYDLRNLRLSSALNLALPGLCFQQGSGSRANSGRHRYPFVLSPVPLPHTYG